MLLPRAETGNATAEWSATYGAANSAEKRVDGASAPAPECDVRVRVEWY